MKKNSFNIKRMLALLVMIFAGLVLTTITALLIMSPGKPELYLDKNGKPLAGSISEKVFLNIGGVNQGMFIKSRNINNPVLLYVHGGPAFPNYFLFDKYKPGLEDYFTVCYWEQRGGGLSYSPKVTIQSMNLDQLSLDAVEVTNYLRKRFGKDKIYMMAHSGGTTIALLAAARNPQFYKAYIGIAQITNQMESEKIAFNYMLDYFSKTGNQKRLSQLNAYNVSGSDSNLISFYTSGLRDRTMHELGIGTMHKMTSVFRDIFIPVWTCKAYTLSEKLKIWKSKFTFLPKTNLNKELCLTDFTGKVRKLDIPVYFLSGKFDLTVNIELSRAYSAQVKAPLKGFYSFENSAHSPLFEEPDRVRYIIEHDILNLRTDLADKD
ncbi:alpha/beta fold hydrolase [Saccharicrinis sp. FJH54]|uniref:alpha/beta fold hydrolase n=1 Tax=Saccharicrinis sp. FJH54 TaxID=3344665 RepID=UPI0035D408BB